MSSIGSIPIWGKPIRLRSATRCHLCGRAIGELGRLLWPGAPTCTEPCCEMVHASLVSELFVGGYGGAIDAWTLRVFCRCVDGQVILCERGSLVARSRELGEAALDLADWQWAYEAWTMVEHPEAHRLGKTVVVPPRRLEDVVRVRLSGPWVRIDPTVGLPAAVAEGIRRFRETGEVALPALEF